MFKKLVSLFMISLFFMSFTSQDGDTFELPELTKQHIQKNQLSSTNRLLTRNNTHDCEHNDCHDQSQHCAHHCRGLCNGVPFEGHLSITETILQENNKTLWYLNNHYSTPFLDPALKPPMFS